VLEELAMGEDDPWRVVARHVEAGVFPRHPYGRPIIGYPDTLRALTPEAMRDYYGRFYHPSNATLVVCGDIDAERALRAVRKRFERLPAGPAYERVDCFRAPLEPPGGALRVQLAWDDPGRRLCMAWPTAKVGSDDDYALDLAVTLLAGGRLSRLHRRLVLEEGLATSISASNDTRVEGGLLWLMAECAQDVEPAALEAAIDEELARLARERVGTSERERTLALLASSEAYDAETVSDVAEELGEYAVDYDWHMTYDGGKRHERVSAAALRETVARLIVPERRVVCWSLPKAEAPPATRVARARKSARAKARAGRAERDGGRAAARGRGRAR
jgi:zinc protease